MTFQQKEYRGKCTRCGAETIHWEQIPGPEDDPLGYSFSTTCPECESLGGGTPHPRGLVPLSEGHHPSLRVFEPVDVFLEYDAIVRVADDDELVTSFNRFLRTLHELPGARVIFTTGWIRELDEASLAELLPEELAERVVGHAAGAAASGEPSDKYSDIQSYRRAHHLQDQRFVIIDHDARPYPAGSPLVLIELGKGFSPEAVQRFFQLLGFPSGMGPLMTADHVWERFPTET